MDRRSFIGSTLALAVAPAIVRVDSLMRVVAPGALVLWGDGIHDDAASLQALFDGKRVIHKDASKLSRSHDGGVMLAGGTYAVGSTIHLGGSARNNIISGCTFTAIKDMPASHTMFYLDTNISRPPLENCSLYVSRDHLRY